MQPQARQGPNKKLRAGFRWSFLVSEKGSPFKCDGCTDRDWETRNCQNHKGLTDDALAVTEYTPDVIDEHRVKKAGKVWTTGDIRLYECPISYIAAETNEIIGQCYRTEDSKRLLFQGEWAEQPVWFVEAMDIYRNESAQRAKRQAPNGGKKS